MHKLDKQFYLKPFMNSMIAVRFLVEKLLNTQEKNNNVIFDGILFCFENLHR